MRKLAGTAAMVAAVLSWAGTAAQAQPGLTLVTSPNVTGSDYDQLDGVAVASAGNAWAVGFARHAQPNCCAPFRALIEHWNGTAWSIRAAAPLPSGDDTRLNAVAVVSPSDVWAVGALAVPGGATHALIEHWNGTAWSTVPAPAAEPAGGVLKGITAVSASDIWAVGYSNDGSGFTTLIEHWNGTAWSLVPSPTITAGNAQDSLSGVTALNGHDIWAVGSVLANFSATSTLALHWNGTAWKIVTSANRGSDALSAVAGGAPGQSLWAAGNSSGGTPATATLIETTTG